MSLLNSSIIVCHMSHWVNDVLSGWFKNEIDHWRCCGIYDIWYLSSQLTQDITEIFWGEDSSLTPLKNVLAHWSACDGQRFCTIQYVWCPPSMHYLCACATVLLCSDAHLQLQTEEGGSGEKGTLICMWGASLDKAEDNKECILGHSDESHQRCKLTSKWAGCDPHLHGYPSMFIRLFNGGTLAGFLGALLQILLLIINSNVARYND